MKHNLKAFTVIEMIITLAIVTLLTGYAMPGYQNFKRNQVMTLSINNLVSSLHYARNQSIITGNDIIVCPSVSLNGCDGGSAWHLGWVIFKDENHNRQLDSNELIISTEQAMEENLEANASEFRPIIRYDRLGASPGTNLSIRFCDQRGAEYGKKIIVNNIGRPRVAATNRC